MKKLTEDQENLMLEIERLISRNESDQIYEEILTQEIDNDFIPHKRFPTLLAALYKKGYIKKIIEPDSGEGTAVILQKCEIDLLPADLQKLRNTM